MLFLQISIFFKAPVYVLFGHGVFSKQLRWELLDGPTQLYVTLRSPFTIRPMV